jgi:hypothetical protein
VSAPTEALLAQVAALARVRGASAPDPGAVAALLRDLGAETGDTAAWHATAPERAGIPAPVVRALALARPPELPQAATALLTLHALHGQQVRRLRSAAAYPVSLLFPLGVAWSVLASVGLPALARVGAATTAAPGPLGFPLVPFALGLLGLLVIALLVGRTVPGLRPVWDEVDDVLFLGAVRAPSLHGAEPRAALRGAAALVPGRIAAQALHVADNLEAYRHDGPAAWPWGEFLLGAAQARIFAESAAAALAQATILLDRHLPDHLARVQLVAMLIAGAAVFFTFLAWYGPQTDVLRG